ncbi:hypothetical protein XENOCAPTIV_001868, partial [Xenoophorus captivus]
KHEREEGRKHGERPPGVCMMDGAGKERPSDSSRTVPCPVHLETDVSSLLWKHKDCISSNETTSLHQKNKDNIYMDNQKAVLDLKDVPSPPPPPLPHYPSTSQLSQAFPSAPLPPACLPPSLQLTRDSHQRYPPSKRQQEGASPKVSICTHCDYCSTDGYGLLGGRGVVGSSICTPQTASNSLRAPIGSSSGSSRLDPCSVALSVHRYDNLNHEAPDPLLTLGCTPQLLSSVATSQPLSLQPYFPCCSGLLHSCSALPLPLSQHSTFPSSAPLSSSVASPPAPVQDSCLVSSGFYTCGVDCTTSTRTSQRTSLCDHPSSTTVTTSTTSAHFYSNPVLQDVKHTVCQNGTHFCQVCLLKPKTGLSSESKLWGDIPAPPTVPIPLPICNGCGTSCDGMMLMPSPKHGKIGYKYENSVPESIPPVGVFWDIENCSVPSGRSAEAVVQRIRSRFFQGHREAEFICVCDISKESKAVIQELNNCQVTVAHINATAKNAADDKLRQSLRRFADTHTAPATVVLVSSDVNFASELSDLRHRHGFQVILIHGNHTSSTLLQHAHRHVPFQEITADLPLRMLVKSQSSFSLLYVHNLPIICDKTLQNAVKLRLRRLSDNCGGKVQSMAQGSAVLRFGSPEAAARARKRMDNEDVFGYRISLSFSPRPRDDVGPGAQLQAKPRSFKTKVSVLAPFPTISSSSFLPLEKPSSPRRPRRATRPFPTSGLVPERPYSPRRGSSGPPGGAPAKPHQEMVNMETKSKVGLPHLGRRRAASSSPHRNETGAREEQTKFGLTGESIHKRYCRKLVIGDLYKLSDVLSVREQGSSRLVCLLPNIQIHKSPLGSSRSQEGSSSASGSPVVFEELEYHEPVCRLHYAKQDFR